MELTNIKVKGLLSFGENGIDLPLERLNVFIGANASGKSNFLEVLNLYRMIRRNGTIGWPTSDLKNDKENLNSQKYVSDYLNNGPSEVPLHISVTANVETYGKGFEGNINRVKKFNVNVKHELDFFSKPKENFLQVRDENFSVQYPNNEEFIRNIIKRSGFEAFELVNESTNAYKMLPLGNGYWSILCRLDAAQRNEFKQYYDLVNGSYFYRDWHFGPNSTYRNNIIKVQDSNILYEDLSNWALTVDKIYSIDEEKFMTFYNAFDPSVKRLKIRLEPLYQNLEIYEYSGSVNLVKRLSDGTLRYLALLAILLNPTPPPITCIEEPELGMHPDIIPTIAKLLIEASERTQLFVTTHSVQLVDALSHMPEAVVACDKVEGETVMKRLDYNEIEPYLEKFSLGKLWASGKIGANRFQ